MRIIIVWLILLAVASPSYAQTNKDEYRRTARALLEEQARGQLEYLVKSLDKTKGTTKDLQDAVDAMKMIVYNLAYGQYLCIVGGSLEKRVEMDACIRKVGEEMARTYGLATSYGSAIGGARAAKCEMRHRLFAAEIEFPPFEFLRGAMLFDLGKMNECVTAD